MKPYYGEPTIEELRKYIGNGYCWICKKGGWRRLAQHTAMKHQIYADDIRDMAFLIKRIPTCIPEESEAMSIRTQRLFKEGKRKAPDWHLTSRHHKYSRAGLHSLRIKMPIMWVALTDEVKERARIKTGEVLSHPHPCPVCGKIIPHAKPICCSEECRKQRRLIGLQVGYDLATPRHLARMRAIVREKFSKSHKCPTCGKVIPKSRPKYCSTECASQVFKLPIDIITARYLNGESSLKLAKIYGCCDHTIRRHLRKSGIAIRKRWS